MSSEYKINNKIIPMSNKINHEQMPYSIWNKIKKGEIIFVDFCKIRLFLI